MPAQTRNTTPAARERKLRYKTRLSDDTPRLEIVRDKAAHRSRDYYRDKKLNDPAWYTAFKAKSRRISKEKRSTRDGWLREAFRNLRTKSARRGIPFDIELSDVEIVDTCPITGRAFVIGVGNHPDNPSFDKIKPALGYVRGNVKLISAHANKLKNNETDPAIFEKLAAYVRGEL